MHSAKITNTSGHTTSLPLLNRFLVTSPIIFINLVNQLIFNANKFIKSVKLKKIKLIWDFKGETASKTAEHHQKHLNDYIALENLELKLTGHKHLHQMHSLAYIVVYENKMIAVRDALKPHRGEIYNDLS